MADVQHSFAAALFEPGSALPPAIARSESPSAKRRFDIYRNNVTSSLVEALKASYPVVCHLVGEEFFKAAATHYVRQEPPRSPLLFRYGAGFALFLERFPPAETVPYLGDIARLEWAWLQAYHAADRAPLSIQTLAEIPPEQLSALRFLMHPSFALLRSRWPVVSLWAAVRDQEDGPKLDMTRSEEAAVLRPGYDVMVQLLPHGGYEFLSALESGRSLGEAAQRAAENDPDFDLAHHLQGLFGLGAVAEIVAPEEAPAFQQS